MAQTQSSLSLVTTCKGRLEHLQQSLPRMVAVPNTHCIVVDYGCPQQSGRWVQQNFPQVYVEFVTDDAEFCLSRARNFGADAVTSPWVLFVDADVLLQPEFASWLQQPREPGGIYGAALTDASSRGTLLCRADAFFAVGGYDEVIRGWGGEDNELYLRLREAGGIALAFPPNLMVPIEHDDALRTTFQPIKDCFLQHRINFLYTHLKSDIGRFSPAFLTMEGRRQIMAEASRTVLSAAAQGGAIHFEVDLAEVAIPQIRHWGMRRKIIYDTTPVLEVGAAANAAPGAQANAGPNARPPAQPEKLADNQIKVGNGRGLELTLTVIPGEATQAMSKEIFVNASYAAPPQPVTPATIVDIGAGVGLTAAYFRLLYPEADIYCFESDAAALALLHTNVGVIGKAEVNPQASTSHATGSATALDALAFLPKVDILKLASAASSLPILRSLHPRLADIGAIYVDFSDVAMRDKVTALLGDTLRNSHVLWKAQVLSGGSDVSSAQRGVLIYVQQSAMVEAA